MRVQRVDRCDFRERGGHMLQQDVGLRDARRPERRAGHLVIDDRRRRAERDELDAVLLRALHQAAGA